MPAKEIKELRQSGKLQEAYDMAKAELDAQPDNVWAKRNLSWVLYSQMDQVSSNLDQFLDKLDELKALELPATEEMLYDTLSVAIARTTRHLANQQNVDLNSLWLLFDNVRCLPLVKPSKWYSVLFQAFHKGFKGTDRYVPFVEWWGLENFTDEDYRKSKMPDGTEIMAIAEQAYIAYSKQLLPKHDGFGEIIFNKERVQDFIPKLDRVIDNHPELDYLPYYKAKLLLALGDKDNLLSAILPFAKKMRHAFWVWEVLSEAFTKDEEKVLACYCRALACKAPEEMLVNLRLKMALIFIRMELYNEAKTEIEKLVAARAAKGWPIPNIILQWQASGWYKQATAKKSNKDFYTKHIPIAEGLLFSDVEEESILVTFVNTDKRIINFINIDNNEGFFKYDRLLDRAAIGDTLRVRFKDKNQGGLHKVFTAAHGSDERLKQQFFKEVKGEVRIADGKEFGFLEDVFLHPTIVSKNKLATGMSIKGRAMKSFDPKKGQWGWRIVSIEKSIV